ncbi:hypothetical protein [Mesorhizobium sp. Root157]|uniref:hypothetical protein n=1 Tax=Mesorhizobium sp. Root157 TaxID=1736477 RepID=UPI000A68F801|nr:hypothetical protein [Mesorhizobium sp. Root157]
MVRIFREQQAKQGRSGWHVLVVLIVAMLLAVVVWGGVEFYGETIDNQANTPTQNSPQ